MLSFQSIWKVRDSVVLRADFKERSSSSRGAIASKSPCARSHLALRRRRTGAKVSGQNSIGMKDRSLIITRERQFGSDHGKMVSKANYLYKKPSAILSVSWK